MVEMARKLRPLIEKAAQSLSDEEAGSAPQLYEQWQSGKTYTAGHKLREGGATYKVLMEHKAQEDWEPSKTPSLYARVLTGENGEISPWEQPDSTNPHAKGDKVTHKGKTWVSDLDGNVWEPGVYGWSEVV